MVGLVVVSHSQTAADGIAAVAGEMGGETRIESVGGDGQGGFGTVADDIEAAIEAADGGDGVVVLVDLGSAVMNAEVAIESSEVDAVIADAPVLEGTVNAAVTATSPKATVESVREQAEAARGVEKL
ncbi:PTS-dependent dihydroxyacetone kinase phosphotransferase subunit DhaM [Haloarcula rara]|uniref:PTS-dependent dihydroxyacetone kinase phosphotransferase subunit DhaM n=1 Tax=Haloarcula rara TaxID=3033387 RepID=UPI0023E8E80B|nr:PTS mannose transporter subunit IID [Halomicroarcula sp. SHR3]